jgi:hypothetical protein
MRIDDDFSGGPGRTIPGGTGGNTESNDRNGNPSGGTGTGTGTPGNSRIGTADGIGATPGGTGRPKPGTGRPKPGTGRGPGRPRKSGNDTGDDADGTGDGSPFAGNVPESSPLTILAGGKKTDSETVLFLHTAFAIAAAVRGPHWAVQKERLIPLAERLEKHGKKSAIFKPLLDSLPGLAIGIELLGILAVPIAVEMQLAKQQKEKTDNDTNSASATGNDQATPNSFFDQQIRG